MTNNKVYCENCKYFKETNNYFLGCGGFIDRYCKFYSIDCEKINRNNNCLYYKRKWWKFWVK